MKSYNIIWGLFVLISVLASPFYSNAQPVDNSPFAQFGIGDFLEQNFIHSVNMSGISTGYSDSYHWNVLNPASLASLKRTSYNVGAHVERTTFSLSSSSNSAKEEVRLWNGNMNYLAVGIPLRNATNIFEERRSEDLGLGLGISLMPYTRTTQSTRFTTNNELLGEIQEDIVLTGGTNKLRVGIASRFKNLSFGFNLGYIFGNLERNQIIDLPEDITAARTIFERNSKISGFTSDLSAQYTFDLDQGLIGSGVEEEAENRMLTLGIQITPSHRFNADNEIFNRARQVTQRIDTIAFAQNVKENGKLGTDLSFGITYAKGRRLMLGINADFGFWKNFEFEESSPAMTDNWRLKVGGVYHPDPRDVLNYWKRVGYQAGLQYGTDPRIVVHDQIHIFKASAGVELPFITKQRQFGFLSLGVEYGNVNSDLIQEKNWRFNIGFTFTDNQWFIKRKYD